MEAKTNINIHTYILMILEYYYKSFEFQVCVRLFFKVTFANGSTVVYCCCWSCNYLKLKFSLN